MLLLDETVYNNPLPILESAPPHIIMKYLILSLAIMITLLLYLRRRNLPMSWFWKVIDRWAATKQEKELTTFVNILRAMDSSEIGSVVALTTHARHALEGMGHYIMNPIPYTADNPSFPVFLSRLLRECQKHNKKHEAAGLIVWLHTARASLRLNMRGRAREMWGQLSRGFPHVDEAMISYFSLTGILLTTSGYSQFPEGFTPEPL